MQVSQHEAHTRNGLIFNQHKQLLNEIPPPLTMVNGLDAENQRLLIEAYLKLLDAIAGSQPSARILPSITRKRYLVYVHGISEYRHGYSDKWWQALQPYVGKVFEDGKLGDTRREVLWSDLVNLRNLIDVVDTAKKQQLRLEIASILEERQRREVAVNTGGGPQIRQAMQTRQIERGAGLAIDDFLIYMLDSEMRQQIINSFTNTVKPLLSSNNQIDIICHSWGSVIAYEGLRELEADQSLQGYVSNFFTVGSALSIGPVRDSLRSENKDGRRPSMVNKWINLDAKGDLVGGMLGDIFEITQENLELNPTGCPREWFGYNLICAHISYFHKDNTNVNRDIFARWIMA